ncbi:MAG: cell division protein ZapA [Flavobacteriales bacterium]|jgi:cell division protein ZapA|nr:cell division protein ZapA [Flavobacteriales bacterium]
MEERSISIELAGRAYPLSIHPGEEANVRQAVAEINESIARLKASHPLTDRQDLLAMAALEVAVRALNTASPQRRAQMEQAVAAMEQALAGVAA